MNPLKFIRLVHFILSQGPDITFQCEVLVAFIKKLADQYAGQALAMSDELVESAGVDNPELLEICQKFDAAERSDGANPAADTRGVFADLIKFVIENPEKVIGFIDLFKGLFGLQAK